MQRGSQRQAVTESGSSQDGEDQVQTSASALFGTVVPGTGSQDRVSTFGGSAANSTDLQMRHQKLCAYYILRSSPPSRTFVIVNTVWQVQDIFYQVF